MRWLTLPVLWFLLMLCVVSSRAQSPDSLMEQANLAYMDESWDEAMDMYETILQMEVESAPLYYNMGNTAYQLGELGRAILYYERALRLNPSYEPALHNLELARKGIINPIESIPVLFYQRWHENFIALFSADMWAIALIIGLTLCVISIALFLLKQIIWQKKLFLSLAASFLLITLIAAYAAQRQYHRLRHKQEVIVMEEVLTVRSAPAGRGTELFRVYEGTKAEIIHRMDSWKELRFADGNVGWLDAADVAQI